MIKIRQQEENIGQTVMKILINYQFAPKAKLSGEIKEFCKFAIKFYNDISDEEIQATNVFDMLQSIAEVRKLFSMQVESLESMLRR